MQGEEKKKQTSLEDTSQPIPQVSAFLSVAKVPFNFSVWCLGFWLLYYYLLSVL